MTLRLRLATLCMLVLGACAAVTGVSNDPVLISSQNLDKLIGRQWQLKTITVDGSPVIMHVDATQLIRFGSDGKVTGFGGVNRYSGAYQFSPEGALSWPGPGLISTRMAGPPELMDKERAFLNGLPKTSRAVVVGHALQLQSEDGSNVLVFSEQGY
jgi:heat shock protein HslJ